jgi:hypothetical protein
MFHARPCKTFLGVDSFYTIEVAVKKVWHQMTEKWLKNTIKIVGELIRHKSVLRSRILRLAVGLNKNYIILVTIYFEWKYIGIQLMCEVVSRLISILHSTVCI